MKFASIKTIPFSQQRYETLGDWQVKKDGSIKVLVSETGDWRVNFLLSIHELVEAGLCANAGITQDMVDEFDMSHPDLDEPGAHESAPYCRQHGIAHIVERLLCHELGMNWDEYESMLEHMK